MHKFTFNFFKEILNGAINQYLSSNVYSSEIVWEEDVKVYQLKRDWSTNHTGLEPGVGEFNFK